MFCVQKTHPTLIWLTIPSNPSVGFQIFLSGNPKAVASDLVVDVGFNETAHTAPIDWIPVDNRVYAVRIISYWNASSRHSNRCILFVSPCSSTDYISDGLHEYLHAKDTDTRLDRLSSGEAHLSDTFGLGFCRSENGDRLLIYASCSSIC